jgi:hypothetical protein
MIELQAGIACRGQNRRLCQLAHWTAVDERLQDVLLDMVIRIDDRRRVSRTRGSSGWPLLAAAQQQRASPSTQNSERTMRIYDTIRIAMQGVFQELGLAA